MQFFSLSSRKLGCYVQRAELTDYKAEKTYDAFVHLWILLLLFYCFSFLGDGDRLNIAFSLFSLEFLMHSSSCNCWLYCWLWEDVDVHLPSWIHMELPSLHFLHEHIQFTKFLTSRSYRALRMNSTALKKKNNTKGSIGGSMLLHVWSWNSGLSHTYSLKLTRQQNIAKRLKKEVFFRCGKFSIER